MIPCEWIRRLCRHDDQRKHDMDYMEQMNVSSSERTQWLYLTLQVGESEFGAGRS